MAEWVTRRAKHLREKKIYWPSVLLFFVQYASLEKTDKFSILNRPEMNECDRMCLALIVGQWKWSQFGVCRRDWENEGPVLRENGRGVGTFHGSNSQESGCGEGSLSLPLCWPYIAFGVPCHAFEFMRFHEISSAIVATLYLQEKREKDEVHDYIRNACGQSDAKLFQFSTQFELQLLCCWPESEDRWPLKNRWWTICDSKYIQGDPLNI